MSPRRTTIRSSRAACSSTMSTVASVEALSDTTRTKSSKVCPRMEARASARKRSPLYTGSPMVTGGVLTDILALRRAGSHRSPGVSRRPTDDPLREAPQAAPGLREGDADDGSVGDEADGGGQEHGHRRRAAGAFEQGEHGEVYRGERQRPEEWRDRVPKQVRRRDPADAVQQPVVVDEEQHDVIREDSRR